VCHVLMAFATSPTSLASRPCRSLGLSLVVGLPPPQLSCSGAGVHSRWRVYISPSPASCPSLGKLGQNILVHAGHTARIDARRIELRSDTDKSHRTRRERRCSRAQRSCGRGRMHPWVHSAAAAAGGVRERQADRQQRCRRCRCRGGGSSGPGLRARVRHEQAGANL